MALLIGICVCVGLYAYFNPFQSKAERRSGSRRSRAKGNAGEGLLFLLVLSVVGMLALSFVGGYRPVMQALWGQVDQIQTINNGLEEYSAGLDAQNDARDAAAKATRIAEGWQTP